MSSRTYGVRAALPLLLVLSCWDGTYSTKSGREFDYEKATKITAGVSRANVVAILGAPASVRQTPDGAEVIEYSYLLERTSGVQLGVRVPTSRQQRRRKAVFVIRDGRVSKADVTDQLL